MHFQVTTHSSSYTLKKKIDKNIYAKLNLVMAKSRLERTEDLALFHLTATN